MEIDGKVAEAVELLKEAGRLDLLREEALITGRPVRKASAGVATAVVACSPPRAATMQVKGVAQGAAAAQGVSAAGKGRAGRRGLRKRALRVSLGAETSADSASGAANMRIKMGLQGEARPQGWGMLRAGARLGHSKDGGRGDQEESVRVGESKDPRVPISEKWPTMLRWSSSDEDGGDVGGGWPEVEGPLVDRSKGAPRKVYGARKAGTSLREEEISLGGDVSGEEEGCEVRGRVKVFSAPGTPDLSWQETLDYDEDDPGKLGGARSPWEEEKEGPRAGSRMTSPGRRGRRQGAADASSGLCGGVGLAPPMPQPGRSNVRAHQGGGREAEEGIPAARGAGSMVSVLAGEWWRWMKWSRM
ncbi:hypothetical protein NDU88_010001 [Pleurodeles waltl]|uniref:Uncharacterized protein n=1 Tax=Pleurodeles waltl TaxID=8319 RepID=A0AAV7S011_PLEWA|nr:hypothetical protein NDU88_010001 [Pleurodeles waltl]